MALEVVCCDDGDGDEDGHEVYRLGRKMPPVVGALLLRCGSTTTEPPPVLVDVEVLAVSCLLLSSSLSSSYEHSDDDERLGRTFRLLSIVKDDDNKIPAAVV